MTTSSLAAAQRRVNGATAALLTRKRRPMTKDEIIADLRVKLAMAEHERDVALAEIQRLTSLADTAYARTYAARKEASRVASGEVEGGVYFNGRRVVNQVEAGAILGVPQWAISRWLNKFEKAVIPGKKRALIYADTLYKPERGKPGRKKKGS